ncbi:DUF418 domain-containing protein [Staphylococcus edaphicus]|uniref:DUF418 domain-containing protein n=1 Tax=Staphylococcus edaphicus TaxID=1955013 RepID=A0A2C6WP15_9STAP|nr:DUF418 domain-containing protein [Staphylococcus edaphicus]PHK49873.1 hypothetical protein BTJ66_06245 [Staphylococcus edaphicus]UQW80847.1 DUF418 domain-containing protein [Staphylococcus edaphicus]
MSSQQRLFELDALRGLSLLGIILMNILEFSFPYEQVNLSEVLVGSNAAILHVVTLFVIGSFYPIFAFLFGYGLRIMYDNSQRKGLNYYPLIYRRLTFLMVLGLIHGMFIFSGDILFGYALTGMIAVLFIQSKTKSLVKGALILFSLKIILLVAPFAISSLLNDPYEQINYTGIPLSTLIEYNQNGNYLEFLKVNVIESIYSIIDVIFGSAYFEYLPYILIGMTAQKLNLVRKIQQQNQAAIKWGIICLSVGYLIKLPYALDYANHSYQLISTIGGPIVAAGYILLFIAVYQYTKAARLLKVFTYLGKLSLSVYLSQSVILTFIFMGVGLGLYDKLPLYQSYAIALTLYVVQIFACYGYLKYFKLGPMEWIWRKFTYLK